MTSADSRTLFVTGASGFIGRSVVRELVRRGRWRLRCLVRDGSAAPEPGADVIRGNLDQPGSYAQALSGVDAVLHLGARVGGGPRVEHYRVNVEGTRGLLAACRQAGVARFVFVSSIAAGFPDKTAYHYAETKWQAEQLVRASGLNFLIVRPTFVLGEHSPSMDKIVRVATLPVLPIIGTGRVRVQPIHVDDVATYLAAVLDEASLPDRDVDLGGPEVLSFEELLRRVRRAKLGRHGPAIHLPARPAIRALVWLERLAGGALPISAGPFATFINDSTARPDPIVASHLPHMKSLGDMLEHRGSDG